MIPREQIKYAQQEILKAGRELSFANMRLEGSQYESECRNVLEALRALNTKLVDYLRK